MCEDICGLVPVTFRGTHPVLLTSGDLDSVQRHEQVNSDLLDPFHLEFILYNKVVSHDTANPTLFYHQNVI